jgi:hypothetical protein
MMVQILNVNNVLVSIIIIILNIFIIINTISSLPLPSSLPSHHYHHHYHLIIIIIVGKASSVKASECVDVDQICDPGQYITIFNDKSVCFDVPIDYYCYNGRCLLDCSNIASSSRRSYGYTSSCQGFQGNPCQSISIRDGPKSTKTGSMACTSSDTNHVKSPADCPKGSYGYDDTYTYGCYPCEAGTSRQQSDGLFSCLPCSVGLASGKGSGSCNSASTLNPFSRKSSKPTQKKSKRYPSPKPTRRRYIYRTHSPSRKPTNKKMN